MQSSLSDLTDPLCIFYASGTDTEIVKLLHNIKVFYKSDWNPETYCKGTVHPAKYCK